MKPIEQIRADFPILSATADSKRPLVYLDTAATAQKPEAVIETINQMHRTLNANIHRGIYTMAEETTAQYEAARQNVADFIGAKSTREVVFTSGGTESVNLVASSFGEKYINEGDNIIITEMEHHSNIVPWQLTALRRKAELRVLPFRDDGSLEIEKLSELMDERTRIIAVTQASNILGTVPDVKQIIRQAHRRDIPVLVDGCQGVVHGGADVSDMDCDFYLFSGHKLYGPTGTGVLYGKEKWLEALPPYKGGGDMIATVTLPQGTTYAELPLKFEAGTSNYIGAIGLSAAIDYIREVGDTSTYENELTDYITSLLTHRIEGLTVYGTTPDKCPIVSFGIEGAFPQDIGMIIDKLGVAIRTGTHCAEPVMQHYGQTAMCRISIGMYNTRDEMDVAIEAIKKAADMLR